MRRTLIALTFLIPSIVLGQYDDLATGTRGAWKLPGLAVAVVQNDRVVYIKAFGGDLIWLCGHFLDRFVGVDDMAFFVMNVVAMAAVAGRAHL